MVEVKVWGYTIIFPVFSVVYAYFMLQKRHINRAYVTKTCYIKPFIFVISMLCMPFYIPRRSLLIPCIYQCLFGEVSLLSAVLPGVRMIPLSLPCIIFLPFLLTLLETHR